MKLRINDLSVGQLIYPPAVLVGDVIVSTVLGGALHAVTFFTMAFWEPHTQFLTSYCVVAVIFNGILVIASRKMHFRINFYSSAVAIIIVSFLAIYLYLVTFVASNDTTTVVLINAWHAIFSDPASFDTVMVSNFGYRAVWPVTYWVGLLCTYYLSIVVQLLIQSKSAGSRHDL